MHCAFLVQRWGGSEASAKEVDSATIGGSGVVVDIVVVVGWVVELEVVGSVPK
jgi:hypothetical protein